MPSRACPGAQTPFWGLSDPSRGAAHTASLHWGHLPCASHREAGVFWPRPAGACGGRDVRATSTSAVVPGAAVERKVGWFSDSRPGCSSLAGGWVGTALSPIPVSLQRAPSFRLSHREGEKLQLSLGAELFPHHFLRRGPGPRGGRAGPAPIGPVRRAHSKAAAPGPPRCYLPGAPGTPPAQACPGRIERFRPPGKNRPQPQADQFSPSWASPVGGRGCGGCVSGTGRPGEHTRRALCHTRERPRSCGSPRGVLTPLGSGEHRHPLPVTSPQKAAGSKCRYRQALR